MIDVVFMSTVLSVYLSFFLLSIAIILILLSFMTIYLSFPFFSSRGADLGSPSLLQPYETSRQRKVVPLIAGLQALHHLYGSTWSPIVALRSFGLQSVDALPLLKNVFAKYAMSH